MHNICYKNVINQNATLTTYPFHNCNFYPISFSLLLNVSFVAWDIFNPIARFPDTSFSFWSKKFHTCNFRLHFYIISRKIQHAKPFLNNLNQVNIYLFDISSIFNAPFVVVSTFFSDPIWAFIPLLAIIEVVVSDISFLVVHTLCRFSRFL